MRQQLAEVHPGFTILLELTLAAKEFGIRFQEGEATPLGERLRWSLSMKFIQHRLRFEQLQLTRTTRHEHVDHVLNLRREMPIPRLHRLSNSFSGALTR